MIGVDWGTTRFRAFRITADGTIRDRRDRPRGIQNLPDGRYAETLREEIGPWLAAGEDRVLLSGMIGSRQGWKEAPYFPCPAGAAELAAALVDVPFTWARVKLVPGLSAAGESGVPEVMRGEETQVIGVLAAFGGGGHRLPARHALEMGASRGRADRALHHAHDRRGLCSAGRPHDPGSHDARGCARPGGVRRRA